MNKERIKLFELFIKSAMQGHNISAELITVNAESKTIELSGLKPSWEKAQKWARLFQNYMSGVVGKITETEDQISFAIPDEDALVSNIKAGSANQLDDKAFIEHFENKF